jgi:hypothetical protein
MRSWQRSSGENRRFSCLEKVLEDFFHGLSAAAYAGPRHPLPGAIERARRVDPAAAGRDDRHVVAQPAGVEGRVADADVGRQPDEHDLRDAVAAREKDFARGFAKALVEYALGRPCGFRDEPLVESIVTRAEAKNFAMREFIFALVQSEAFRSK